MHKGYMGFVDENDNRYENDTRVWEETGVAPTESWNMDKVILRFLATRLAWYDDKPIGHSCLTKAERDEISQMARVFEAASEDFMGEVCYTGEWIRLGELLNKLWN